MPVAFVAFMTQAFPTDAAAAPDVLARSLLHKPTSSFHGTLSRAGAVDVRELTRQLKRAITGDAASDPATLGLNAQDASNYYQLPLAVVAPRSCQDVIAAVSVCREFGVAITCRAGGTALAGQTCNEAVVFDFSRYMTRILSLDAAARRARVEPGVICDELVHAARPHGLTWGPKPATHNRCCFGGMLANNCGGMEAQYGGIAVENVVSLDILLYDGTRMQVGFMDEAELEAAGTRPGREGQIYRELAALRARYRDRVRERFPDIPRRVSGYNLDRLLPDESGRINVARALIGSEGTCAITLEAELELLPVPAAQTVVCIGFSSVYEAADAVPAVLTYEPMICEGMDQRLVGYVKHKGGHRAQLLPLLPEGEGWLLVKLGADSQHAVEQRARDLCDELCRAPHHGVATKVYDSESDQDGLWKLRESGLGATAFVPGERDAWPGWEDSAVPPARLGDYLRDLRKLFDRYGYTPSLYGHFGQGLVHCRVQFELTTARGVSQYAAFAREAAELCAHTYGGSLSGEHGDGQARGWLLETMFGPELVQAFREFKQIWDPDRKMNPGKLVDADPVDAHLRLGPHYDPAEPATYFKFPEDDGSLARAALRCVGVGKCRRKAADGEAPDDVMCPSYMVTHDEKHSTRGRAHLLWLMLRNGANGVRAEHVKESLDLCLACKGCKTGCPVNVDMATYKAEFLSHYWQDRSRPRQAYAFGLIDKWARLAALAPGLANLITHAAPTRSMAKWIAGMSDTQEAPRFAAETFQSWFARRAPSAAGERRVVLWPDTFNNHFHPHTARAAVEVLERLGYQVIVPQLPMCCGRPLYDFGFLELARSYLERVLQGLAPWIEEGLPVVVLEPSCASVFRDELGNLMPARLEAQRLRDQTKLLSELLVQDGCELPRLDRRAIVQGHCHHKSLLGYDAESQLFERMGTHAELLSSGCCGMAGAFGFERDPDKQRVSRDCGERVLFPAVRAAPSDTLIIADGFSCRNQVEAGTARHALHVAEVVALALQPNAAVAAEPRWRERIPERLASAGLACLAAGVALGSFAFRAHAWRTA
jgi:FAD/FMN-containing dehydrogenase/Fe-S oxidoreductase